MASSKKKYKKNKLHIETHLCITFLMYYIKSPFQRYPLVELQLCKGNINEECLLQWLCKTPAITTYRVNHTLTTTDKFKNEVETLLKERYEQPPKVFTMQQVPEILCIGPIEPAIPLIINPLYHEVIIDSNCGSAVLRGAHIYSTGILAMETGTKKDEFVNVYADIEGKCLKGYNARYISEYKLFLGVGRVLMIRHDLFTQNEHIKSGVALEMINVTSNVPCIGNLSSPKALLQNLPSIICVKVLDPQKGETILDMCAGSGNKTTHIMELMQDDGIIIALDKVTKKISSLNKTIEQLQIKSIKAFRYDATKSFNNCTNANTIMYHPPFKAETFDRILLDVPCSALGQRPLLNTQISPKMLQSYPILQRKLFSRAVPLLKIGGCLVYSTCTVNVAENEELIVWALKKYPQLKLQETKPMIGDHAWSCNNLKEDQRRMMQRFGPTCHTSATNIDTIGFFIAKLTKK